LPAVGQTLQLAESEQVVAEAGEELVPVAWCGLPAEAEGWIPGGGFAVEAPAPFGLVLEEEPGGAAESTGEVGEGGVGGENEIAAEKDGGDVEEVPGGIDQILGGEEAMAEGTGGELLGAVSLLEGEEGGGCALGEDGEGFEGEGASSAGGGFVGGVSLPVKGEEWPGCVGEA
jgi:hypothetical protein